MKIQLIIVFLIILLTSCSNSLRKEQSKENFDSLNTTKSVLETDSNYEKINNSKKVDSTPYSFVLSCGSGCALTYDLRDKRQLNSEQLELTFNITMYVNEQIADEYSESYIIKHSNNKINEIYSSDNQILLEEASPNLFLEIKKLSGILIGNVSN